MTDTVDTVDTREDGNTSSRARYWSFTWHGYKKSDLTDLEDFMVEECTRASFQEEYTQDMKPHIQGAFEFKNARYFNAMKKRFPEMNLSHTRNRIRALNYGTKDRSRIPGGKRFHMGFVPKREIKNPMQGKVLKEWQLEINSLIEEEADDRTINWYYDFEGGQGKTTWCKGLCIERPNEVLYLSGKGTDVKYGVKTFIDNEENDLKVCIFDFTRTTENYISYEALEAIKNGLFYNSKYESEMVVFNAPHVIVFANFEPDVNKLSKDRWRIREITPEGKAIVPYIKKKTLRDMVTNVNDS